MELKKSGVFFRTDNELVQTLFDAAEKKCQDNLKAFLNRKVLIEGGGYHKIWLETQPMGGEMYAKRDMEAAINNQLLFMEYQREDGRLPGSITVEDGAIIPQFNKFQGFCFPAPALNMYYLTGKDTDYLAMLYRSLEAFDHYLWAVRDSDEDGCLETWCMTDTGEDHARRYGDDAPFWWTEETPPQGYSKVPIASMDLMGFSHAARETLAHIAGIMEPKRQVYWQQRAFEVRKKIREYLWDNKRGALFDRDKNHNVMDVLLHNTLRVMYWGGVDQDMADRFIREHLLNPQEFWTAFPLPSVAVNDPLFFNNPENDWSGQAEGLTYQRAIRALENYGREALLPVLGDKLFRAIGKEAKFTQQFDPFTGKPSGDKDGYGPTMLSVLEYISRLYGVHREQDTLVFNTTKGEMTVYTQVFGDDAYEIICDGKTATAKINSKKVQVCPAGTRFKTDLEGNLL